MGARKPRASQAANPTALRLPFASWRRGAWGEGLRWMLDDSNQTRERGHPRKQRLLANCCLCETMDQLASVRRLGTEPADCRQDHAASRGMHSDPPTARAE